MPEHFSNRSSDTGNPMEMSRSGKLREYWGPYVGAVICGLTTIASGAAAVDASQTAINNQHNELYIYGGGAAAFAITGFLFLKPIPKFVEMRRQRLSIIDNK